MPSRRLVLPLCAALMVAPFSAVTVSAAEQAPSISQDVELPASQAGDRVARGLIVRTASGTSTATLLKAAERLSGSDADVADATQSTSTYSTVSFEEPVAYDDAAQIAADLQERPDVLAAVPDGRIRASEVAPVTTNDPAFTRQYQVWDKREADTAPAGGYSVKAPALWRSTKGSPSVVVAVLDTGILKDHPDLKNQLVAGYDMIGADQDADGSALPAGSKYRFYTANDGNGRDNDPSDPGDWINKNDRYCYGDEDNAFESSSWHGSHVAGIIAAQANNKTGITGIAPRTRIQPVRVLGKCSGWDSDLLAGITWASGGSVKGVPANKTPADIINMSLGGQVETSAEQQQACAVYGPAIAGARSRGTTVIAAVGNDLGDADLSIPSSCDGVIGVGATSERGFQAFYSNEGSTVDISAPGGDMVVERSADYRHGVLSTINTGLKKPAKSSYAEYQGTSMATPAVAAGAALLTSLGVSGPSAMETALKSSVSSFRHSINRSDVVLTGGGKTYHLDLNCTTSDCGAGVLDLSRVPAPIGSPVVSGTSAEGELLTAVSQWTGRSSVAKVFQWYRDGAAIEGATSSTYTVTGADVGHRLAVRVRVASGPFAAIGRTSAATNTVGLTIAASGLPSSTTYGRPASVDVTLTDVSGPRDGTLELRRGTTVVARRATTSTSTVNLTVPGTAWAGGANALRAVFTSGSQGAASASTTVTVYRAVPTSTKLTMGSTVNHTGNGTMWARVYVPGVTHPRGTFGVYDGSRRIQTATIAANANGIKKITLPRLAKGKHTLRVKFLGTSVVAPKTSARKTVTSR